MLSDHRARLLVLFELLSLALLNPACSILLGYPRILVSYVHLVNARGKPCHTRKQASSGSKTATTDASGK